MAFFGPWWKLKPVIAALARINKFRGIYRRHRLHSLEYLPSSGPVDPPAPEPPHDQRSADGSHNDPNDPNMGRVNTRFGRNFPRNSQFPDPPDKILKPSPREVSRRLMARDRFIPAETLNLLAASWIQFQVHDWFSHGTNEKKKPWKIPLEGNDDWHQNPMEIRRTREDPTRNDTEKIHPPSYLNTETHWWDGSQIYGSKLSIQKQVRANEDGKLALTDDALLLLDPKKPNIDLTGVNGNWWLGLSMLHTLFTYEHNAICDALKAENPAWDDEQLFQKARLINVALMSKIHTIDWTPAILANKITVRGMHGTWYGLRGEKGFRKRGRPKKPSELRHGIPGSKQKHHTAPYAMTEEFVSVYRMHPLMPDDFSFHRVTDHKSLGDKTLTEISAGESRGMMEDHDLADLFYSFGVSHPGAITLHNYPNTLRELERPDGRVIDLASIDIMRDRERGVPRYNEFRRRVFKDPVKKFEQITGEKGQKPIANELREMYDDDIEAVDLMSGLYAEKLPPGFGFSDTAFRIFAVMAPRRLKSDRFITDSYGPDIYTETGINWVENNRFRDVLLRHMPSLAATISAKKNPFAPWTKAR